MDKSPNSGHRSRLRRKFETGGLEVLEEHEILELLLFYIIPRRDTNGMAHDIINKFGSLINVLSADKQQLLDAGIGEATAEYLSNLKNITENYYRSRYLDENKYFIVDNLPERMLNYYSRADSNSSYYLILMNTRHKCLFECPLDISPSSGKNLMSEVIALASRYMAYYVVIACLKPEGAVLCEEDDVEIANELIESFKHVNMQLSDYIITDGKRVFSFKREFD